MPQIDTEDIQEGFENTYNSAKESVSSFFRMTWPERWEALGDWALHTGWIILQIVVIIVVAKWLIKKIDKLIDRIFVRRNVDTSINTFVRSMLRIVGWLVVIMLIVSILGIKTTSIAALIAAVGFAIGMALSGTLQNFAGGIMILLLKPFRTGDYIQAQGYEGTVKEIKLFSTIMRTSDNKTVIIPNGGLSTNIVNNFSSSGTRRVEWTFGISYGDDYDLAKQTIKEMLGKDARIQAAPPYFIAMKELTPVAISIVVRAWVKTGDFWDVYYDMNEKVYKIFPMRGLNIPYNSNNMNVTLVDPSKPEKAKSPKKQSEKVSEHEIMSSSNDMKDSENSVASMDDSHDKLQGMVSDKLSDNTPLIEENAASLEEGDGGETK